MDRFLNHKAIILYQAVWAEVVKKKMALPIPGQNFEFRIGPGRTRAKISISLSGWAGLGPKFQFLFRVGRGPGPIFLFFTSGLAGPGLKNSARADLWCMYNYTLYY